MTLLPEFDPSNVAPKDFEQVSLLGPFFKLSAYPDSAVSNKFCFYFISKGYLVFVFVIA
jgi:hypothetical protein